MPGRNSGAASRSRFRNELAIAFAGPVGGDVLKLTNNPWVIRPALMQEKLGVERFVIVNDFAAIAHAVAGLGASAYRHVCGPEHDLPESGVVSIVGPGTGLGVASLLKRPGGHDVIATEGGHIDWAPLDPLEDRHPRTSSREFPARVGRAAGVGQGAAQHLRGAWNDREEAVHASGREGPLDGGTDR